MPKATITLKSQINIDILVRAEHAHPYLIGFLNSIQRLKSDASNRSKETAGIPDLPLCPTSDSAWASSCDAGRAPSYINADAILAEGTGNPTHTTLKMMICARKTPKYILKDRADIDCCPRDPSAQIKDIRDAPHRGTAVGFDHDGMRPKISLG